MAYLRVEKPHFLFLEGSAGAEATADVATVALSDASAARTGTSAACVASSVDRPAAGASAPAPGACSSAASAALGEGGAGSHLSTASAPRHSPPLQPPTTNPAMSQGGKPLLLTQPEFFVSLLLALPAPDPPLLLPRSVHGHPLLGRTRRQSRGDTWRKNKGKGEESTHQRTIRKHNERLEVVVAVLDSPEVDGAPRGGYRAGLARYRLGCYGSARYGSARYGSLRYRAESLARLGSFKSSSQLVSS
jgi:hypothetical protein